MKAKICGVTQLQDACYAADNGAWAIGFNFYEHSPRYISLERAALIIDALPSTVLKIGIFIGKSLSFIIEAMDKYGLDFA